MSSSAVIVLSPIDNVAVCRRNVAVGEALTMDGETAVAACDLLIGHKVARRSIPRGTEVIKYGMSIGSATTDIAPGDWVHLHNLQSNYFSIHAQTSQAPL